MQKLCGSYAKVAVLCSLGSATQRHSSFSPCDKLHRPRDLRRSYAEVAPKFLFLRLRMVDFAMLKNVVSLQRQRPPCIFCFCMADFAISIYTRSWSRQHPPLNLQYGPPEFMYLCMVQTLLANFKDAVSL